MNRFFKFAKKFQIKADIFDDGDKCDQVIDQEVDKQIKESGMSREIVSHAKERVNKDKTCGIKTYKQETKEPKSVDQPLDPTSTGALKQKKVKKPKFRVTWKKFVGAFKGLGYSKHAISSKYMDKGEHIYYYLDVEKEFNEKKDKLSLNFNTNKNKSFEIFNERGKPYWYRSAAAIARFKNKVETGQASGDDPSESTEAAVQVRCETILAVADGRIKLGKISDGTYKYNPYGPIKDMIAREEKICTADVLFANTITSVNRIAKYKAQFFERSMSKKSLSESPNRSEMSTSKGKNNNTKSRYDTVASITSIISTISGSASPQKRKSDEKKVVKPKEIMYIPVPYFNPANNKKPKQAYFKGIPKYLIQYYRMDPYNSQKVEAKLVKENFFRSTNDD
uniref:MBD domain-containing protein n=1 Tax=Parastrongyloides trichosuri TaxID=131310 RepID=A0A0N4Z7D2_PARTI